jgi:HD-GYP domain-containing protein (c-di-GMP phosphodiesterase class II)
LTYQLQTLVAQCQNESALCGAPTAEHLGQVVSRVVDYLQTHQQDLAIADPLDNNLTSNELQAFLRMAQLLDQMDLTTPMTSANVATLAEAMGQLLDLPAWQLHRLRLAGLLHRVAFLPTVETVLTATPSVTTQAIYPDTPPSCPLIPGVQVLRKMQQIKAIATILAHQTEWWNGSGQPAGLSGDAIPIESRILALVTDFQQQVVARSQETESPELALEAAMAACRSKAGDRYDPKLIETLELLVLSLKQGFSLPVTLPKIAGGLWLVDSHSAEELITFDDAASLNEL